MTLAEALVSTRAAFVAAGMEEAPLESELLVRFVAETDRAAFFTQPERILTDREESLLEQLKERRLRGEPFAYITGHREFFGIDFTVNHDVLIPRPETELLVETALARCRERLYPVVADIGTGCGTIALSIAVNCTDCTITATDISSHALAIAEDNARRLGLESKITFLHGDLLEPLTEPVDIICANLPYIPSSEIPGNGPLYYEPREALDGGPEGLDAINGLLHRCEEKLKPYGVLLLEIGIGQVEAVVTRIRKEIPDAAIDVFNDLAGIPRIVQMCLTR